VSGAFYAPWAGEGNQFLQIKPGFCPLLVIQGR
jgi:hypothetical protein